jgi:hypothetical protein
MHFTAAMSGGWRSKASGVATGLLIAPALLFQWHQVEPPPSPSISSQL